MTWAYIGIGAVIAFELVALILAIKNYKGV